MHGSGKHDVYCAISTGLLLSLYRLCSQKYGYAVKAIHSQRAFLVEFIDSRLRINTDFTLSLHQKKEIYYQLDKECVS